LKPRLCPVFPTDEDLLIWFNLGDDFDLMLAYRRADRRDAGIMLRIGLAKDRSPASERPCAHSILSATVYFNRDPGAAFQVPDISYFA
jgi:hypothetical protein